MAVITIIEPSTSVSVQEVSTYVVDNPALNAEYFKQLRDTPDNFTGKANQAVTVKSDEMGLEFTDFQTQIDSKADYAATSAALATKADDTATAAALSSLGSQVATKADDMATSAALSSLSAQVATKADDAATTAALATKADDVATTAALATKADDGATSAALSSLGAQVSTKLNSTSYTAADVLAKIKTVDGAGSGLDADTVDGYGAAALAKLAADNYYTGNAIYQHTEGVWANDSTSTARQLTYVSGGNYSTFGNDTLPTMIRGSKVVFQGFTASEIGADVDGMLIRQGGSSSDSMRVESLGEVHIHADTNDNAVGSIIRFKTGADEIAYIDDNRMVIKGVPGYSKARFGHGTGDSFVEFRDGTDDSWRTFGWDDSASAWVCEIDGGGVHGLWHKGNDGDLFRAGRKNTLVFNDTVCNENHYANHIDYNVSGSDACTADRTHIGLYVDVDSSASGGDTSEEHRVYGTHSHVTLSGDSDLGYGAYNYALDQHTTGQVTALRACYNYAYADNQDVSGITSETTASFNYAAAGNVGTLNNLYGTYSKALVGTGATGGVGTAYGSYNEVEVDGNSLTTAYASRSIIDTDAGTLNNGYLFAGEYQGALPANAYGLYLKGENNRNRIEGGMDLFGTGNASTGSKETSGLTVSAWVPHLTFVDRSTNAGQGAFLYETDRLKYYSDSGVNDGTVGAGANTTDSLVFEVHDTGMKFMDNKKIWLGNDSDSELYWGGTHTAFDLKNGNLDVRNNGTTFASFERTTGDLDITGQFKQNGVPLAAPTTSQVGTANAGLAVGAVGSYMFATLWSSTTLVEGATVAGSSLRPFTLYSSTNISGGTNVSSMGGSSDGTALTGTWRAMGAGVITSSRSRATLWLRIS